MMLVRMISVLVLSGALVATSAVPGFSQERTVRAKYGPGVVPEAPSFCQSHLGGASVGPQAAPP